MVLYKAAGGGISRMMLSADTRATFFLCFGPPFSFVIFSIYRSLCRMRKFSDARAWRTASLFYLVASGTHCDEQQVRSYRSSFSLVSGAKKIFEINAIFFPVSLLQSNHQVAAGKRNLQAANSPENESPLRLGEGHAAGRSH